MGMTTYNEVGATHKKSLYYNINCLVLSFEYNIKAGQYITDPENPNHVFTRIDNLQEIPALLAYITSHFNNFNISIAGGSTIYSLFLSFYDTFYLTLEKNIKFEEGVKLFRSYLPNQKNILLNEQRDINDCIKIMLHYGLYISEIKELSPNTTLYTFKKI